MTLYYLSQADLPGRKAHAIQQVRMCEAFTRAGTETTLVHPGYLGTGRTNWSELAEYYGVDERFDVVTVPTLLHESGLVPKIGGGSMVAAMTAALLYRFAGGSLGGSDILYSRNEYVSRVLAKLFSRIDGKTPTTCFELHNAPERFDPSFVRAVDGFVCISEKLRDEFLDSYDISGDRCLVAHDGVRLDSYRGGCPGRATLGLPEDPLVMYTGHAYEGKGVETLVRAASRIDAVVYIVGGYDRDIDRVRRSCEVPENVVFTGFVSPDEISLYQQCADVLVAPYDERSREYVSPLKLFEYMAAGIPVVASSLPVLEEVLEHGENCLLFERGDPVSLANGITRVLEDDALARRLATCAGEQVKTYSWQTRAERVLSFLRRVQERDSQS